MKGKFYIRNWKYVIVFAFVNVALPEKVSKFGFTSAKWWNLPNRGKRP